MSWCQHLTLSNRQCMQIHFITVFIKSIWTEQLCHSYDWLFAKLNWKCRPEQHISNVNKINLTGSDVKLHVSSKKEHLMKTKNKQAAWQLLGMRQSCNSVNVYTKSYTRLHLGCANYTPVVVTCHWSKGYVLSIMQTIACRRHIAAWVSLAEILRSSFLIESWWHPR